MRAKVSTIQVTLDDKKKIIEVAERMSEEVGYKISQRVALMILVSNKLKEFK